MIINKFSAKFLSISSLTFSEKNLQFYFRRKISIDISFHILQKNSQFFISFSFQAQSYSRQNFYRHLQEKLTILFHFYSRPKTILNKILFDIFFHILQEKFTIQFYFYFRPKILDLNSSNPPIGRTGLSINSSHNRNPLILPSIADFPFVRLISEFSSEFS